MPTLKDLLAQRAALEKQIQETQSQERSQAIAQIRSLMAEYGLSVADVQQPQPARKGKKTAVRSGAKPAGKSKVAPKFRDAATGNTWSGRGLQPNWLKAALAAGRSIEEFRL
jgi:DNA-binding protein H-NS